MELLPASAFVFRCNIWLVLTGLCFSFAKRCPVKIYGTKAPRWHEDLTYRAVILVSGSWTDGGDLVAASRVTLEFVDFDFIS